MSAVASGHPLLRTPFHTQHIAAGAKMVDFGGWDMPVQYPTGIIAEHLATRSGAGLFDVSHMGRFVVRGPGAAAFLQHVLTNNAEALDLLQAQYTMVPTESGGAVDDAYLYRFVDGEHLLVVNASNRHKDWDHFRDHLAHFPDVEMSDETGEIAMVALQGKASRDTPVSEIMTGKVIYVTPEKTVEDCMAIMTEKHIRHLPVLNADKEVLGMISIGDVVKEMISDQKFIISQLENYITG